MAGPTAREHAYDIKLNGVPYRIHRENDVPAWGFVPMPAVAGKALEMQERPRVWDTWHLGAGYQEIALDGAYSYAVGADLRFPRQALPGPRVFTPNQTTLNGAINNAVTSLTVASATGFPASGNYNILIDNEIMTVTAGQGTTTWTVSRAQGGTTAAAHSNGAGVLVSVSIAAFFVQSNALYYLAGKDCRRLVINATEGTVDTIAAQDSGDDGIDFDTAAGAGTGHVATAGVNFDGNTVVGFSSAHDMFKFDGTTWTECATGIQSAALTRFWSDNADDWVLAGALLSTAQLYTCAQGADPAVLANWAGPIDVGDTSSAITGLAASERTLWVGKTDGLYYVQLTRTPRVLETKVIKSTNGQNLLVDPAGMVFYPCQEAYYRYDPTSGEAADVSPARGLPNAFSMGAITAHVTYKGWLYAAVWDGTNAYLVCGRAREGGEQGIGPIIWHGSLTPAYTSKITAMFVAGGNINKSGATALTTPRLYFGHANGSIRYFKLPGNGDNPILDSTYEYTGTNAQIILSRDNWGIPSSRFQLLQFEVESSEASSFTPLDVYLYFDGVAISAANLGLYLGQITTSPRQVLTVPLTVTTLSADITSGAASMTVASASGFPASGRYYIILDTEVLQVTAGQGTTTWTISRAQRGTSAAAHSANALVLPDTRFTTCQVVVQFGDFQGTTPVILKSVTGYAAQRAPQYALYRTKIFCSDRVASSFGVAHRVSGKQQIANLMALGTGGLGGITQMEDWFTGSKRTSTVLVSPPREQTVKYTHDSRESEELVAEIDIAVLVAA